jgi:hypothetical protein
MLASAWRLALDSHSQSVRKHTAEQLGTSLLGESEHEAERAREAKTGGERAELRAALHACEQKAVQRAQSSAEEKGVATRVPNGKKGKFVGGPGRELVRPRRPLSLSSSTSRGPRGMRACLAISTEPSVLSCPPSARRAAGT